MSIASTAYPASARNIALPPRPQARSRARPDFSKLLCCARKGSGAGISLGSSAYRLFHFSRSLINQEIRPAWAVVVLPKTVIPAYAGIQEFPAQAGIQSKGNELIQIFPTRISAFDEVQFPCSSPLLNLFFSRYGIFWILVDLVIDELFHTIFGSKSFYYALPVLPYSLRQIGGHSSVQSAITPAGQDVHVELPAHN
jgi:hypothetical protein